MQVKIDENVKSETPEFPAFYLDKDGDLWYFDKGGDGIIIHSPGSNAGHKCDFASADRWNPRKVVGTITITQE